jgi:tRNA nucleotidyltransferase (CCA-adding enzyme)
MVKLRNINNCVNQAKEIALQIIDEITERELKIEEDFAKYNIDYIPQYSLKDLQKVQDAVDQLNHHRRIRDNILLDNGESAFNIVKKKK